MKTSIEELLGYTLEASASDLHLSTGSKPMVRIHGQIKKLDLPIMDLEAMLAIKNSVLNKNQQKMIPKLVKKGERVCMIYYTKKKIGHNKYKFTYSRKIPLETKHFKSGVGHLSRHGIGPSPDELLNRKDRKKLGIVS